MKISAICLLALLGVTLVAALGTLKVVQEGELCGALEMGDSYLHLQCDEGLECMSFGVDLSAHGRCYRSDVLRMVKLIDDTPEDDTTPRPDTPSSLFITGLAIGLEGTIGQPDACFSDAPRFGDNLTTFFNFVNRQSFSISSIKPIVSTLADLLGNIRITSAECGLTSRSKKLVQFVMLPVVTVVEQSVYIFKHRDELKGDFNDLRDATKAKDYLSAGIATGKFIGIVIGF